MTHIRMRHWLVKGRCDVCVRACMCVCMRACHLLLAAYVCACDPTFLYLTIM